MHFLSLVVLLLCFFGQTFAFDNRASPAARPPPPDNSVTLSNVSESDHQSPPKPDLSPTFPLEELIPVPDEKEKNRFLTEFISTMATLGLIIAFILMFGWFLKRMVNNRMVQANDTCEIQIVERRMISPKTAIFAIEVKGKGVILAETANGVVPLGEYPVEETSSEKTPSAFKKLLEPK